MKEQRSLEETSGFVSRFDLDFAAARPDGKKAPRRPSRKETAKSAISHWGVAKSLKTGPWLSETCAFGDPEEQQTQEAYAIRDIWRFRIHSAPNLCAAPTTSVEPVYSHDQVEEAVLARSLVLGQRWAKQETEIVKASEEGDAAMVFCGFVLQLVRAGKLTALDLDRTLRKLWTYSFVDPYRRELRNDVEQHAGLLTQEPENNDEPMAAGYAANADDETELDERTRREALARSSAVAKLAAMSPTDRRLCEAVLNWDELDGKMTNARLGAQLGVSETAVRKRFKKMRETLEAQA